MSPDAVRAAHAEWGSRAAGTGAGHYAVGENIDWPQEWCVRRMRGHSGRSGHAMLCGSREADYADSESLKERAAVSTGCSDDRAGLRICSANPQGGRMVDLRGSPVTCDRPLLWQLQSDHQLEGRAIKSLSLGSASATVRGRPKLAANTSGGFEATHALRSWER